MYAVNANNEKHNCDNWTVFLGLPGTPNEARLLIHMPEHRIMRTITVCSGPPHDKALLCTLFAAVHFLCSNPILTNAPTVPMPFCKHDEFRPLQSVPSKVFLEESTQRIHKVYDTTNSDTDFNTSIHLMRTTKQFTSLGSYSLSKNERFKVLNYDYIVGDHIPLNLTHFVGVIKALHIVHTKGFVHGDVRSENIIYGTDGKGYLIDFDFAKKERQHYPASYNNLVERHKDAVAQKVMLKEHDRHSLAFLMEKFCKEKEIEIKQSILSDLNTHRTIVTYT